MIIGLWESIIVAIVFLGNIFLGFLVFLKNKKSPRNCYFLGLSIFIAFWILAAYISEFFPLTRPNLSVFFSKLAVANTLISLYFLFLFSFVFINKFQSKQIKIISTLGVAVISLLTIFSPFIVKDIFILPNGEFNIVYGNLFYILYLPYTLILIFFSLFNLISHYKILPKEERIKLNYFFLGLGIFIIATIIGNILLPLITGSDIYYRLGNYSSIFFVGFTAYAIVAKQLFGIKVILTDFLVAIMGILLLILPIVVPSNSLKLLTTILFLLFCVFGYLLISYTHQEIKKKEELQRAYNELKELDESKTMFLSIASHQLRTPLSAMKGYLSMVLSGDYGTKIEGQVKEFLEKVYQSNERLINLVNDLLDITRLQMGRMKLYFQPTQIEEIVQSVVDELNVQAKKKNLSLIFKKPSQPLPKVNVDPQKIRQVVLNLIDNAIKYTKEGKITVKLQYHSSSPNLGGKSCLIAVKDTGIGMTPKEIDNLFQLFERSESAVRTHAVGVGIGLYAAREIVKAHKGKIWAESKGRNQGSTFYVELPIE